MEGRLSLLRPTKLDSDRVGLAMDDKVGESTVGDGGYDIIGDVHGQADMLQRLLADLGYEESGVTSTPTISSI